jgi:cytochrome c biogenesis protein CcmG/thiol:disulfide interchange protein DsbE
LPELDKLYARYKNRGVTVVALTDSPADADNRRIADTVTFPVGHTDAATLKRFGVDAVPVTVFVGRNGALASRVEGEGNLALFEARLKELL